MTDILKLAVELYQAVVARRSRAWMPVISSIHTVRSPSFARSTTHVKLVMSLTLASILRRGSQPVTDLVWFELRLLK